MHTFPTETTKKITFFQYADLHDMPLSRMV